MATAKTQKVTAQPWAPAPAAEPEVETVTETTQSDDAAPAAEPEVETVTVTVPKAYRLQIDHHKELQFKAGVQQMEREHAEHWFSVANGVTIYDPKAK